MFGQRRWRCVIFIAPTWRRNAAASGVSADSLKHKHRTGLVYGANWSPAAALKHYIGFDRQHAKLTRVAKGGHTCFLSIA
ncbi:hypothetical protein Poly24_34210 [Rosistilla carotiformis]|uniref:Uncharacterized protein n=1 Tax=Rosistilla carotiformis TaxID=2528017 RepID=A0A518JVZ1_9BACT|nr:hypothetical protein Poly24_34210 [Rosistilla carotiformis]